METTIIIRNGKVYNATTRAYLAWPCSTCMLLAQAWSKNESARCDRDACKLYWMNSDEVNIARSLDKGE